jgi:hypothetical protein
MSHQSPAAHTGDQGPGERPDDKSRPDERNADEDNESKGHAAPKGTDIPATTKAEDMDKAKRTTM